MSSRVPPLLKSRDPHLAGGEKQTDHERNTSILSNREHDERPSQTIGVAA